MSFLSFLKPVAQGVDNAAHGTFNFLNTVGNSKPVAAVNNFTDNADKLAVNSVIKPTADFAAAGVKSVYDIGRGAAASATNNPVALEHAHQAKATDFPKFAAPIYKPLVQGAETIVHPFSQHSFTPTTPDQKLILGNEPVQNINAGVASNYREHPNLPLPARVGLATAYGVGQAAIDLGGAKGFKEAGGDLVKATKGKPVGLGIKPVDETNPNVRTPEAPLTPDDLHQLTKATSGKDVHKVLDPVTGPKIAEDVAPAIIGTKDPGVIDNIVTKAGTPVQVQAPPNTSVPPPILPPETPKAPISTPEVKPDVQAGSQTLEGLANMSNSVDEFHQKLSSLPEDANVRAAMEKSGAANISDLYHQIKPDAFQQVVDALNGKPAAKGQAAVQGIESARAQQNALLAQERGQRFNQSAAAGAEQAGTPGYLAERAALKGEYTKVPYHPLISDLGEARAEEIFSGARDRILATPDSTYEKLGLHPQGARFNTQVAVRKVLGLEPGLPTSSEIKLLRVFSPELAKVAEETKPRFHQLMDYAAQVPGSIRGIKSTADFSMGGRQGLFVAARHPEQWAMANVESVKYAKDGQYFKDSMKQISNDPWVKAGEANGLQLPGSRLHPEEQYAGSNLIQGHVAKDILKVGNVVAGSERAYDGGLTYLRAALFKSRLMQYGATPEEAIAKLGSKKNGLSGLAEAVNTLTGRGGKQGGFIEKHINTLSETLFSPRLWASRLELFNPKFWTRIGPAGRAEAVQSLGSFASVVSLVMGAAVAAGATVETDPRSSDFLKIKVGDTRYDVLGGLQQNVVWAARELTGEKKSSTNGSVTKFARGITDIGKKNPPEVAKGIGVPNRFSILTDLAGNKLNPVFSSAKKLISGKDSSGQPVNYATEIGQLFVPISLQGTAQTISSTGSIPEGILKNAPDYFGVGSQTYGVKDLSISDKQNQYIQKLQSAGSPKDKVAGSKLFYQTIKTVPPKNDAYKQIDAALKAGDQKKAIDLARSYNSQFSGAFTDWRKQYPQLRNDPTLTASYAARQITDDELQQRIDKIASGG